MSSLWLSFSSWFFINVMIFELFTSNQSILHKANLFKYWYLRLGTCGWPCVSTTWLFNFCIFSIFWLTSLLINVQFLKCQESSWDIVFRCRNSLKNETYEIEAERNSIRMSTEMTKSSKHVMSLLIRSYVFFHATYWRCRFNVLGIHSLTNLSLKRVFRCMFTTHFDNVSFYFFLIGIIFIAYNS